VCGWCRCWICWCGLSCMWSAGEAVVVSGIVSFDQSCVFVSHSTCVGGQVCRSSPDTCTLGLVVESPVGLLRAATGKQRDYVCMLLPPFCNKQTHSIIQLRSPPPRAGMCT
jgi:hypothetical protein